MAARRVVITGVGVVSCIGRDKDTFWQSLCEGRCGIGPLEVDDREQLRFDRSAQIRDYDPGDYFEGKTGKQLDRFAQFALIAAREAIQDTGIQWTDELRGRTAIVTGSSLGGQDVQHESHVELFIKKGKRLHPLSIPRAMANSGASQISMEFGFTGPAFTTTTACSSSNHAIGNAYWLVRNGAADAAVTGGSEAPFSLAHLKGWEALRVIAPDTCRPFALGRQGMVLGEGGAMLVIETLEGAKARGARIYAEIVGFGMSADASHITQPTAEGPAKALAAALADAKLDPRQVDHINGHGTGTLANDPKEAEAIRRVFGEHTDRLAVSGTKSMHGHTLGAAGAIEGVAAALTLHHGVIPPTINFTEPDPDCNISVVANEARQMQAQYALSNSFAFGGLNAVLAFQRWAG